MRLAKLLLVLAPLACATAAFAAGTVRVYIPFAFDNNGKHFPASQYEVELSYDSRQLTLNSIEMPEKRIILVGHPADVDRDAPELNIKLETAGDIHELRYIRLGAYEAKISNKHRNSR